MSSLCNLLGYLLNFIYSFVKNYGLALIIFSVLTKLIMLPLSIKQQKTLVKSGKIQKELKEIQDKYSKDQERLAQETMNLYKRENMSPFSGCLSSILQIVLLIAMFILVKEPLTYMLKMPQDKINEYAKMINSSNSAYSQIEIINAAKTNDKIDIDVNMDFLGINLSSVLMQNLKNWTTYIIPVLYVLTSIISMKLNQTTTDTNKEDKKKKENKDEEEDPMMQMNKNMQIMMPVMSVTIAIVVPLGLALYWLTNNVLMIGEKLIINRVLKNEEA